MARQGRSRNLFEDFYPSAAEDEDNEETLDETIRQGFISSSMLINAYADRKLESSEPSPNSRLLRWSPVSRDEMKAFFALVILTGVVVKSSIPAYWSTDEIDATPFFGQTMSLTRFQGILSNLHLADN